MGKAELVIDINLELRIAIRNCAIRTAPLIQAIQGEINLGSVAKEVQVGPGVLAVALAAVAEGTQETAVVIATADSVICARCRAAARGGNAPIRHQPTGGVIAKGVGRAGVRAPQQEGFQAPMAAVGLAAAGAVGPIGAGGHRAVAAPGRRAALVAVIGAGRAVKGTHPLNCVGAVGASAAGVVEAHRPGRRPGGATQWLVIADAGAEHLHCTARQGLAEVGGGEGGLGLAVEHVGVVHPLPGPLAETALAIGHAGIEGVAVGIHPATGVGHGAGAAREHRRRLELVDLHRLNAVGRHRAGHGQVAAEAEGEILDPLGHINRQLERLAVARTPIGAVISDGPHAPLVTTVAATDRAAAADGGAVVRGGVEAEADDLAVIEIDSQGLILPTPAEAIQIGGHQAAFAIEAVGAAHGLAVGLAGRVGLGGERPQET